MSAASILRRWGGLAAALLLAVLATGCAHPISLNANVANLAGSGQAKVDQKIGLNISEEDRKREVTTAGGGGDKVSYFPYRDLETGLYVVLSETFSQVTRVAGTSDAKIKAEGVKYVVTPVLTTTSYSGSIVTWPPTLFSIQATCRITDADGKPVTEIQVSGDGRAEFDEFKSNHSLSAQRASEDMLKKLKAALADAATRLR